jgi:RNA polymerase sigma factor (sigma-70 family)
MDHKPALVVRRTGTPSPADVDAVMDVLFRTHSASLVRLAMLLLGDRGDAEEVVQDAFVSLHRNWPGLRDTAAAGSYLRSAVVRGSRSRQRRLIRARSAIPRLGVVVDPTTIEDRAVDRDQAARIAAAVQALPTRQREVVVARYYLGLTEPQTGQLLGLGLGSVKRHAHRALASLQHGIEVPS